jgi:hypothetical protein
MVDLTVANVIVPGKKILAVEYRSRTDSGPPFSNTLFAQHPFPNTLFAAVT